MSDDRSLTVAALLMAVACGRDIRSGDTTGLAIAPAQSTRSTGAARGSNGQDVRVIPKRDARANLGRDARVKLRRDGRPPQKRPGRASERHGPDQVEVGRRTRSGRLGISQCVASPDHVVTAR